MEHREDVDVDTAARVSAHSITAGDAEMSKLDTPDIVIVPDEERGVPLTDLNQAQTAHVSTKPGIPSDCGETNVCESLGGGARTAKKSNPSPGKHNREQKAAKTFYCIVKKKQNIQTKELYSNARTYISENPFICTICGMDFRNKSCRDKHLATHSEARSRNCKVCEMKFTSKHSLENHMLTHVGETPNQCMVCNKRFVLLSRLTRHMYTHVTEKQFE